VWLWLASGCAAAIAPAPRSKPAPVSETDATRASDEIEHEPRQTAARGWLGVQLGTVDGLGPGVLVRATLPDSPAERAGISTGDVILSVDGVPVNEPSALVSVVGSSSAGRRVGIVFTRGETKRLVAVRLAPVPTADQLMRTSYVGAPAPALVALKTVQGSVEPDLRALKGKIVVIEFWATWCFVCRMMVPVMNEWHARYAAQGVKVIGITSEGVVPASQAATSFGMEYPIASDESGRTTLAYRALALPTVFVIDREGKVLEVMVGYSSTRLTELQAVIERLLVDDNT